MFYDKLREEREGSDVGPEEMFRDFPKNPNAQRVPSALHHSNAEAVSAAEQLDGAFFVFLILFLGFLGYWLNPFREDPYERLHRASHVRISGYCPR